MPSLEYFLVAESVSSDVKRNTLSIFHVLSDIRVEKFPTEVGPIAAVSGWISNENEVKEHTEAQLKLVIRSASHQWEFRGNFKSEVKYQNYTFLFRTVPAPGPGEIIFELFKDEQHIAKHTLTVRDRD